MVAWPSGPRRWFKAPVLSLVILSILSCQSCPSHKTHVVPGLLFFFAPCKSNCIFFNCIKCYCIIVIVVYISFVLLAICYCSAVFDRTFWFSIPSSPYPLAMALWIGCADIDFGNPTPRLAMWTVHKYIQTLKVKKEDLMGIAAVFESQNQVVRLTFHKEAACDAFLLEHQGIKKKKIDDRDFSILIKDSNVQEKFVRISGIPYQMNLGIVKTRFREFGNVLGLRWESYHVVDSELSTYPVLSTWLICRMALEKHIPSYVTIGSYKAVVRYSGQIPTCRICDDREHIGKNCPTLSKNRKVGPTKAPPLQKPHEWKSRITSSLRNRLLWKTKMMGRRM